MASRKKREHILDSKKWASTQSQLLNRASDDLELTTASEMSDGASESMVDTINEPLDVMHGDNAVFDVVQVQLDSQLQKELDSYIEVYHSSIGHEEGLQHKEEDLSRYRTHSSRPSLFDLPEDNISTTMKKSKKPKRNIEEIDSVVPGKQQNSKKKKRKTKSSRLEEAG